MTQQQLLDSLTRIAAPSLASVDEYAAAMAMMIDQVDRTLLARPDLQTLIGGGNTEMMRTNHRNHAEFMVAFSRVYDPPVLIGVVVWVLQTYQAHGFSIGYWPVQLEAWRSAVATSVTPRAVAEIDPIYRWLLDHLPDIATLPPGG